jgi:cysteine desulfurase
MQMTAKPKEDVAAGKDRPIYLDNHATTRLDPRVLKAMMPFLTEEYGNASSRTHAFGWTAEAAVDSARKQVATLIGARPKEMIFTSGATESNNLAVKGVLDFYADRGNHIVTVKTEHKAILDACRALERAGKATVTYLKPDSLGRIAPEQVAQAITDQTVLVSVMHANSEIGVIAPLAEIGRITRDAGVIFHTDAAQSAAKNPIDVDAMGIDLLSLSAHKMYGPKGVGALFVRARDPRVRLSPLVDGGGQEKGMRSGTLNVPGIVGIGAAAEIGAAEMGEESARVSALRDRLCERLTSELDEVTINGDLNSRLSGNLNLSFAYVEGESLLMGLREVALSSGSACTSASLEPSHVLRAIGVDDEAAHSSIRFGLGRFNTAAEIELVSDRVVSEVQRLRRFSALYAAKKEGPTDPAPAR